MSASSQSHPNELNDVATNVQRALRPVAPPPAFRKQLRDGLRMAAEYQQAQRALGFEHKRHGGTWGWLVGAALLGALIGFAAIQFRARRRTSI